MATFKAKNPEAVAALLFGVDYLGKKYRQAEQEYGKPMKAIETEFEDDKGQRWVLTFGPKPVVESE